MENKEQDALEKLGFKKTETKHCTFYSNRNKNEDIVIYKTQFPEIGFRTRLISFETIIALAEIIKPLKEGK